MSKSEVKALRKMQKELCDQLITDVDELDRIIERQLSCRKGFYNYSIGNILLADKQLYARTGETTELLAGYNAWQKHGRFVRKGQKSLKILAPRVWKKENEESGEIEEILYFVKVFSIGRKSCRKHFVQRFYVILKETMIKRCCRDILSARTKLRGCNNSLG